MLGFLPALINEWELKKMARAEQKQNVIYSYWWQKRDEKWLLKFIREGKGPSLHYVNKRTGRMGSEKRNFADVQYCIYVKIVGGSEKD